MASNETIQLRNQAIWETAVDAIVTIDESGIITSYNPAAETLFGYGYDEAMGQNVSLLMPRAYQAQHANALQQRLEQPATKQHSGAIGHSRPLESQHKDGHIIPIRLALSEMFINGQRQFMAIIQDTSELKAAEAALRASEHRLQLSQNFAGIGSWDWNIQTGEIYWTQQIPPLFGYPHGALTTHYEKFISAVHPDDRLLVEAAISACINRGIPYNVEHRVVWPDGSIHWLHGRGDAIRDERDNPVRMMGVVSDITAAKKTLLALHKSEAWFQDITASTSDWIWEVDINGVYTYCSSNVEDILGYRPEEIIGRTPFDLMPPEEAQVIASKFVDIVKHKRPIDNLENWNLTKDGQLICLLTTGVPLLNTKGELLGYRGVDKDITDSKQAEMALIKAKEDAEQANLAKSEFLSNMSHELRTPLNAILGFSQLFGLDNNLNEEQQVNLCEISRAGEHLLELINEILDLSMIEAGHLKLKMEPVPVAEILEECHALSQPMAEKYSVKLHLEMNTAAIVYADRTRFKQALLNLISNGVKYNHTNGTVSVDINEEAQGWWRISVSDTGRGISPENLQELFQPFSRFSHNQDHIEGTGIGLVISKNIVEAMGGVIGVNSTLSKGSTFWIELASEQTSFPPPKTDEENTPTPKMASNNTDLTEHPGRVLIVEDNSINQMHLREQLALLHYEVDIASSGIEALDFLSQKSYQMVLSACNMPQINGYQLTEIIRQQEFGQDCHIPILGISANDDASEDERCRKAGMDDYLAKPVELGQLQAKIENYWTDTSRDKTPLFATSKQSSDKQSHFDIAVLRDTLGNQSSNHQHVLATFMHSSPANVKEIQQAVTSQDAEALHAAAHKLKSAARAIGAKLLAAVCQLLETNSHYRDWDKATVLTAQLTTAITQVEETIADYI